MKRVGWIDAARYIAIFHVVFIHTLDTFSPRLLDYWVTPLCFVFTICAATGCAWLLDRLHRRAAGLLFREKLTA